MWTTAYKFKVVEGTGKKCGKCRHVLGKGTYEVEVYLPEAKTSNHVWCWQCFMSFLFVNEARIYAKTWEEK